MFRKLFGEKAEKVLISLVKRTDKPTDAEYESMLQELISPKLTEFTLNGIFKFKEIATRDEAKNALPKALRLFIKTCKPTASHRSISIAEIFQKPSTEEELHNSIAVPKTPRSP